MTIQTPITMQFNETISLENVSADNLIFSDISFKNGVTCNNNAYLTVIFNSDLYLFTYETSIEEVTFIGKIYDSEATNNTSGWDTSIVGEERTFTVNNFTTLTATGETWLLANATEVSETQGTINQSTMENIASVIKTKTGNSTAMFPSEMADKINTLTYTADATLSSNAQILSGYTAYANGVKYTGTIGSKSAATYTPTTVNQTIAAGQYLSGTQTILGDTDLAAGNIKTGVEIFGVTGTYTADANAAASNIMNGYTAYVNGALVTGNLPDFSTQYF